ncbi:MAG: DUF2029 domain-containing protein [Bacteroidota bacterium]|nr:MAG: DUF2029 domain-containing protein [Bacteroidota bacterium]
MISRLAWSKSTFIGFGLIVLISLAYLFADSANNNLRVIDFKVYYQAAENILWGNSLYNCYIDNDPHYLFKYSPASAMFFIPFHVFPFEVAKIVYWVLLTAIIILGYYLCIQIIDPTLLSQPSRANKIIVLALLPLVLHFTRELHLGQVNHLLLVMYIGALAILLKEKYLLAGLLIAASIYIKPFGFIFLPYFIYKKYYKLAGYSALFLLILGLLPLAFWQSWSMFVAEYQNWKVELLVELKAKQTLLMPENHTIFSVVARYTPLRWILSSSLASMVYQLLMLGGIGLSVLYFIKTALPKNQINPVVAEFGLLTALIPLLAFTTSNAFGFGQILVFLVLIHYAYFTSLQKRLVVVSLIFIGGACSDIIGKKISHAMDDLSLVAIGTILLISLVFILRQKKLV